MVYLRYKRELLLPNITYTGKYKTALNRRFAMKFRKIIM